MHLFPAAVPARVRSVVHLLPEPDEGVDARVRFEVDGAAVAAVAAERAALRDERFSSKRDHPAAAVAGFDVDLRGVEAPHLRGEASLSDGVAVVAPAVL